jgi:hypothetical protein
MLAKVALPRSARTRICFLRENPAMDRLVGAPEPTIVACRFAVNAQQAQPLTNVSHPGLTEDALSMPSRSNSTYISKTLRCYKGETLCKPLFSKTVLHWEPVAAHPSGWAISMRFPMRLQRPLSVVATPYPTALPARSEPVSNPVPDRLAVAASASRRPRLCFDSASKSLVACPVKQGSNGFRREFRRRGITRRIMTAPAAALNANCNYIPKRLRFARFPALVAGRADRRHVCDISK